MKHVRRFLLPAALLMLCLALALVGVACTGGADGTETTAADSTTDAVSDETTVEATDETTAEATDETTAEITDEETESMTEPVTTEAPFVPVFDPDSIACVDLPLSNVAREGFAFGISSRVDAGFSNLHLNDGDLTTGFSTAVQNGIADTEPLWVFVDLAAFQTVSQVKIYPMAGMESGFPIDFDIYASVDGKDYHLVASKDGATATPEGVTVTFPEETVRYVKLVTRKLGAGNASGKYLALGEFEVYGKVNTTSNMILNRHEIWLFKDPDTTQQLELVYFRDGSAIDPNATLTWTTMNPKVATVDENGLVKPVGFGSTDIYVTDGTNLARCRVEVKKDINTETNWVTAFWVANHADVASLADTIGLIADSGVDHIEGTNTCDMRGNFTNLYSIYLCHERGIVYSMRDGVFFNLVSYSNEQILKELKMYENLPGLYGFFVGDEPGEGWHGQGEKIRILHEANPHYIYHMNLLPPIVGGVNGWDEYYTEFAAVVGGGTRYEYLSLDQYPFSGNVFNSAVFSSLETLRQAGLAYNASTGFYVQSQVWRPNFDALSPSARLYNSGIALAYGVKNIKHFIALTPTEAEGGAMYESGILKPDFSPADYYDDIVKTNAYVHRVGEVLAGSDAIEVYHDKGGAGIAASLVLSESFMLQITSNKGTIVSLFDEIDGDRQHIMLTNKIYNVSSAREISFTLKGIEGPISVYDPLEDKTMQVSPDAQGIYTLTMQPGAAMIIELPEGVDARTPVEASENLAAGKGVFVSSSQATFWADSSIGSHFLTDGSLTDGCWKAGAHDTKAYVMVDLGEVKSVNEVRLFGVEKGSIRHFIDYTVSVSADGKNFTTVATVTGASYADLSKPSTATFDSIDARFVRIQSNAYTPAIMLSEIEIYG